MHEDTAGLAGRAVAAFQSGEHDLAAKLCRQAISAMAAAGDYGDMLIVLGNLATSVKDVDQKRRLLAQTVWLALALESPNALLYILALFQALPEGSPLAEPLAAASLMEASRGGKPELDRAEMAMKLVSLVARRKRIVRAEADRYLRQFIASAPKVAAGLLHALDEAIGDSWEFDRSPIIESVGKRLNERIRPGG